MNILTIDALENQDQILYDLRFFEINIHIAFIFKSHQGGLAFFLLKGLKGMFRGHHGLIFENWILNLSVLFIQGVALLQ